MEPHYRRTGQEGAVHNPRKVSLKVKVTRVPGARPTLPLWSVPLNLPSVYACRNMRFHPVVSTVANTTSLCVSVCVSVKQGWTGLMFLKSGEK